MSENIEIKRILDILNNRKILIMLILILFIILGYVYSYYYVVPEYEATSTLLLIPNNDQENRTITNTDLTLNSGLIYTYSNIAKHSKVIKTVINNLGLSLTERQLLQDLEINVVKDTYIIEVIVRNKDPKLATDINKELSNVFLEEIKEIYKLENIGIVDEAQIPEIPYNINHFKDIAIFFGFGIFIIATYTMIVYIFDNTIKNEEDIEKYIGIKSLGNIPMHIDKKHEIVEKNTTKSYVTECINTIRTNILYMNSSKDAKTILITSCTPMEGKSWVSANIATAFAETNKKVLLIDSDMRKGRANKIFKVDNSEGLSNYLYFMTGEIKKDIGLATKFIKETGIPNLHILTNGTIPPNPSEILDSNNMKELIAILKNIYDVIIVDAPPCKLVTDSIILSTIVDSTILVVNSERTKINDLKEVKKSIQIVDGNIIGAILNKVKVTKKTYSKNYYYGHKDLEEKKEEKVVEKKNITVKEVINDAIPKLKQKKYNIFYDEDDMKEEQEEVNNGQGNNNKELYKYIKKQNYYLQNMSNIISEIKVQNNNSLIQNKLKDKENETKLQELIDKKIEGIYLKHTEELSKNISKMEEIYSKIQNENINTTEMIKEIINNNNKTQEIFRKEIINNSNKTQEIFKQEISNINYTEQINAINEMIENLKDSYLELSNRIRSNELEVQRIDNKNVLDIRYFKKQKEKKKKIFFTDEDITYENLENNALYVVPIKQSKMEDNNEENFESVMK